MNGQSVWPVLEAGTYYGGHEEGLRVLKMENRSYVDDPQARERQRSIQGLAAWASSELLC